MINCININRNNLIINDIISKFRKYTNELKKVETICKLKNYILEYNVYDNNNLL